MGKLSLLISMADWSALTHCFASASDTQSDYGFCSDLCSTPVSGAISEVNRL